MWDVCLAYVLERARSCPKAIRGESASTESCLPGTLLWTKIGMARSFRTWAPAHPPCQPVSWLIVSIVSRPFYPTGGCGTG
eukprot:10705892-Lingulodinium_polyedra.AAC.1